MQYIARTYLRNGNFQKLINTNSLLKIVVLTQKLETKRFYHRAVLHENADQNANSKERSSQDKAQKYIY